MPSEIKIINNQLRCRKCKNFQNLNYFHKMKTSKCGYRTICKKCRINDCKNYQIKYKEKISISKKNRYYNNLDEIREKNNIRNRKYYKKHKIKINKWQAKHILKKYHNDINFKLKHSLRNRLRKALNGNYKKGSAVADLGCSIEKFKLWLEMHFQEGMTWDNHGLFGWHIDHIRPLASFDLTDREQHLEACHFTNLQPLWSIDNLMKSDKYNEV